MLLLFGFAHDVIPKVIGALFRSLTLHGWIDFFETTQLIAVAMKTRIVGPTQDDVPPQNTGRNILNEIVP